ncbi:MAG: hypothetical protein WKF61_00515 [Luteimonas sp.]
MTRLMMMRVTVAMLLFLLLPLQVAAQDDVERLRIHGSNTVGARLMPTLVESWLDSIGYKKIKRVARGPNGLEIKRVEVWLL